MARILVVDDYPAILTMLQLTLSAEGYEVLTADNGRAGLELAGQGKPDVMLVDIDMPRMDGVALCADLKRDSATKHIPVLMMSGRLSVGMLARARQVGALAVLAKPFVRTRLLEEITRAIAAVRSGH